MYRSNKSVLGDERGLANKFTNAVGKTVRAIIGPPLKVIEQREREMNHFAKGIGFYKLFWIFFLGCFFGVVVEEIFCFATMYIIECRSGLVLGPFNPVYGFGALALTLALYPLRYKNDFFILVGGTVVGASIEYLCSYIQEKVLGTVSWDYSHLPFNINGRVCLLYSMFWGVLAIIWMKWLYPRMSALILHIPNRFGRAFTWVLVLYMIVNMAISAAAVERWTDRAKGIEPKTKFEQTLDNWFPNSTMEFIYPHMEFVD